MREAAARRRGPATARRARAARRRSASRRAPSSRARATRAARRCARRATRVAGRGSSSSRWRGRYGLGFSWHSSKGSLRDCGDRRRGALGSGGSGRRAARSRRPARLRARRGQGRLPARAARAARRALPGHGRRGPPGAARARRGQPRALEPALPRGPAARPERAAHAGPLPGRACGALASLAPSASLRPRTCSAAAAGRRRGVLPGAARRRRRDPGRAAPPPAHLNDAHAARLRRAALRGPDSDVILGDARCTPLGGPVDLERRLGRRRRLHQVHPHHRLRGRRCCSPPQRALGAAAPASLEPEARFGLAGSARRGTAHDGCMLLQVGIGSGNKAGTFNGDHDVWRLPENDDRLTGARNRYLRERPAFRANAPGEPLPPNLAGRVSAAFALAAQLDAATAPGPRARPSSRPPPRSSRRRRRATCADDVATALPHAFYPESSWRDDLELGAAELALAAQALGDPRAGDWLRVGRLGRALPAREAGADTLNLYDTSALAHAELVRALRAARSPRRSASRRCSPTCARSSTAGVRRSRHDPFRAGVDLRRLRRRLPRLRARRHRRALPAAHGRRPLRRASPPAQRDWALGANPWGVSLMIGVGERFPLCPQHVVANLSGSRTAAAAAARRGRQRPERRSAVRRRARRVLRRGPHLPVATASTATRAFTGHGSRFVDDVRVVADGRAGDRLHGDGRALAFALTGS